MLWEPPCELCLSRARGVDYAQGGSVRGITLGIAAEHQGARCTRMMGAQSGVELRAAAQLLHPEPPTPAVTGLPHRHCVGLDRSERQPLGVHYTVLLNAPALTLYCTRILNSFWLRYKACFLPGCPGLSFFLLSLVGVQE